MAFMYTFQEATCHSRLLATHPKICKPIKKCRKYESHFGISWDTLYYELFLWSEWGFLLVDSELLAMALRYCSSLTLWCQNTAAAPLTPPLSRKKWKEGAAKDRGNLMLYNFSTLNQTVAKDVWPESNLQFTEPCRMFSMSEFWLLYGKKNTSAKPFFRKML